MDFTPSAHAQQQDTLGLALLWQDLPPAGINTKIKAAFKDTLALQHALGSLLGDLQSQGYLEASLENLRWEKENAFATLFVGPQYRWVGLEAGNVPSKLLQEARFKPQNHRGRPIDIQDYQRLRRRLVTYAENHGHPFASLLLDSLYLMEGTIGGVLQYDPGPRIYFDSLIIVGDINIKKRFLTEYLHIGRASSFNKEPAPKLYSEELVQEVGKIIAELPYLVQKSPPEVAFEQGKAYVKLFLEDRKASSIDGIVGLMPNNSRDGRLLFTGQFNVVLHNPFGTGKRLEAEWQRIKPASPSYMFSYLHPNFFRTGLDLDVGLRSFKEDSTFFNLSWRAGLQYRKPKGGSFLLFFESLRSRNLDDNGRVQTLGESGVGNAPPLLPGITGTSFQAYGLRYRLLKLDRPFFPRRGWLVEASGKLGSKSFFPDPEVPDSLFEDVPMQSNQIVLTSEIQKFFPIGRQLSLLFRNRSGKVFNQALYAADLFRLGGLNSMRGFDENIFFASFYSINTAELKLYFENQSAFFVFLDQGFLRDESQQMEAARWPLGIGAGFSLQAKNGLLTLVYSVGRAEGQPMLPQNAKIHFSFLNRF